MPSRLTVLAYDRRQEPARRMTWTTTRFLRPDTVGSRQLRMTGSVSTPLMCYCNRSAWVSQFRVRMGDLWGAVRILDDPCGQTGSDRNVPGDRYLQVT
jgi:hypothetical protein